MVVLEVSRGAEWNSGERPKTNIFAEFASSDKEWFEWFFLSRSLSAFIARAGEIRFRRSASAISNACACESHFFDGWACDHFGEAPKKKLWSCNNNNRNIPLANRAIKWCEWNSAASSLDLHRTDPREILCLAFLTRPESFRLEIVFHSAVDAVARSVSFWSEIMAAASCEWNDKSNTQMWSANERFLRRKRAPTGAEQNMN